MPTINLASAITNNLSSVSGNLSFPDIPIHTSFPMPGIKDMQIGNTTLYATSTSSGREITLLDKDNKNAVIYIIDTKNNVIGGTDKFLLLSQNDSKIEKVQITETFSENDPSLFFFGKKTVPINFSGKVLDADSAESGLEYKGQWAKGLKYFWDTKLRASVLVKNSWIAIIVVDDEIYKGYPIELSFNKSSTDSYSQMFSMSWVITSQIPLINSADLTKFEDYFSNFGDSNMLKHIVTQYFALQTDINILNSIVSTVNKEFTENQSSQIIFSTTDLVGASFMDLTSISPQPQLIANQNEDGSVSLSTTVIASINKKYDGSVTAVPWLSGMVSGNMVTLNNTGAASPSTPFNLLTSRQETLGNYWVKWLNTNKQYLHK